MHLYKIHHTIATAFTALGIAISESHFIDPVTNMLHLVAGRLSLLQLMNERVKIIPDVRIPLA